MKKFGTDSNVKKTLVRNAEYRIKSPMRKQAMQLSSPIESSESLDKCKELEKPTLCSSEVLSHYIQDVKKSLPPPLSTEDLNADRISMSAKVTKKLNFHINDKLYKNLIELNDNITYCKTTKKDKKPPSSISSKRDMEPNIEDFFQDEEETDRAPKIPVIKPKFKAIRKVEVGDLHKLVATFDIL